MHDLARGITGDDRTLADISVLYVEDDEDIREQLARFLRRRVGALYVAANGQEGLDAYLLHKPDVVVSDILMPVMDGLKMSEAIKEMAPATPIIITTAFNETDCFLKAIDLGIDKYVIKPVNTDVLLDAILKSAWTLRAQTEMQLSATVFESSSNAILITDGSNRIIAVNPAFCEITGYTREEVVGRNPGFLSSGRQDADFYRSMWNRIKESGSWSGEIWNRRKNGEVYPEWLTINTVRNRLNEITHHVAIFSDITERKEVEERVSHLAHYDALTDLPNRTLFYDRLLQALIKARRYRTLAAVMFADLDRFKVINDTLGHGVGDLLLQEVAVRLRSCVRQGDTVSRQGGDEFVILLPEISHGEDAALVAKKILDAMAQPFQLQGHELHISASIGISFCPSDGEDAETLMKNADVAMYRAKDQGRNNYQFYQSDMNARSFERLAMETSMRRALERDQFRLHYQPQFDVQSGKMIGVEALIRWHHPDLGVVPPAQFIPLAEETGLILPIGEWVLRSATADIRNLHLAGLPRLRVAVNLSARQFRQPGFADRTRAILQESGLSPHYLELELTESILMSHSEENIAVLRQLKEMGIRIAIDDFGTGYSSLSYLKRLPIDTLKIDRSFVGDIPINRDDTAIVNAIISMAQSLSLKVIAEGVETADQIAMLRERRCDEVQGFYFSRPVPLEEVVRMLTGKDDSEPVKSF